MGRIAERVAPARPFRRTNVIRSQPVSEFTVIKLDTQGNEVLCYPAQVLERGPTWVCLRAVFMFPDVDLGVSVFQTGDVFMEWFYSDRWYNVFRVEAAADGHLKGWYCNITRPAVISTDHVTAEDLALDVFVTVTGKTLILDEDEFAALKLSPGEQAAAWRAVESIRSSVDRREFPFEIAAP